MPSLLFPTLQVFFSLLLVLFLIYVSARYLLPRLSPLASNKRYVQIIEKVPLESQVTLYLVKVGSQTWLIGVGHKQVQLISSVSLENVKPEVSSLAQNKFTSWLSFEKFIRKFKFRGSSCEKEI